MELTLNELRQMLMFNRRRIIALHPVSRICRIPNRDGTRDVIARVLPEAISEPGDFMRTILEFSVHGTPSAPHRLRARRLR